MKSIMIYVIVFTIATFLVIQGKNKSSIYNIIGIGILAIFAAGRYHVGTDMVTYEHSFARYSAYTWVELLRNSNGEILFAAIAKITYSLGGRILSWGTFATLIVVPVYLALKKYYQGISVGVAFFVFLFFYYTISFNVTRQFIAVAFIFWGLHFIYEDRFISFLVIVILATGFHSSAPIALLLWFLWDHKSHYAVVGKRRILLLLMAVILIIGYQSVIEYITTNISLFSRFDEYAETSLAGANRDLYLNILELIILMIFRKSLINADKKNEYMYTLLIITVLVSFTGFTHPQVKRIAYFFAMPSKSVLLGYLSYGFVDQSKWLSKVLVCMYAIFVFILTAYIMQQGNLIPYSFNLALE